MSKSHEKSYRGDVYQAQCPCQGLLDLLANKWSALVIGLLESGRPVRFGELQRQLEGISPKSLTNVLRRLEAGGLVNRVVVPAVPLHVEYSLTDLGMSASSPLAALRSWAEEHHPGLAAGRDSVGAAS
ncbi:winged helix-turn-helix transcriptional regulator [Rhodococcus qingshengii]|uniref:winged helix-turn-helix transcriptional regulator n=1 Tax=Rhodococcus qingshengii TaxID=334542 RepID=UPI001C5D6288|nr:helix-turn-helix domain-containing protein [Rhodococcus qingshengii]MBW4818388.1 helix-turn-helix transcriptional regulator [Rhodococcus qingshengii]